MLRRNTRVLGLAVLATLFLIPLTASAKGEGEFKVGGKTFAELKIEEESISSSIDGVFSLLVAAKAPYQLNCSELALNGGSILLKGILHGTLALTKCTVLEDESPFGEVSCTVDPIEAKVLASIVLHGGHTYLLFTLSSGTVFTTVKLLGNFCSLAKESSLEGSFAVEVDAEAVSPKLTLVNSTTEVLLGDSMTLAGSKASPTGTILVSLSGSNKGKSLAVSPILAEGEFRIAGKTLGELGVSKESISGSLDSTFNYLVSGLGFEINCDAMDLSSGTILPGGMMDATALFLKCTDLVDGFKEELSACAVEDSGLKIKGQISAGLLGQVVLHGGKVYILFTPATGSTFFTLRLAGAECALSGEYPIGGSFGAELGAEATSQTLKLLGKEAETILGDKSQFGVHKAFFNGTMLMSLSGAQIGKAWGAI